ncbi:MAG: ABC transporter permease subunit [Eubacteriales bacterium]
MRDIFILLQRDLKGSVKMRQLIMLVFLLLFQFWFILGSDSVGQVRSTGTMHFMAVVFSFNFFGSIVALAFNYDGISSERESKFLDLILTSDITKKKLYISKILTSLIISFIFALLYVFILMLVYWTMSGDIGLGLMTLRYILPLTAFLLIFSLMGLMLSVVFRSSKTSLITAMIIGGMMMPRLFIMIMDSIGGIFGFADKTMEILYMLSPALIMNALNGYSEMHYVYWALILLAAYLIIVIASGMYSFIRQDELNYGE